MIEQQLRAVLEQQQWTLVVNTASPASPPTALAVVWKMYANGVAVTLSIHDEEGEFVVYTDVGHAGAGTKRTESGRFSSLDAATHHLIQACSQWDSTWET